MADHRAQGEGTGEAFVSDSTDARLAVLETQMKQVLAEQHEQGADLKKLVAAANMAGGAWQATLKIGGLMVIMGGFLYSVVQLILAVARSLGKGG
jgi:hypothetical protein